MSLPLGTANRCLPVPVPRIWVLLQPGFTCNECIICATYAKSAGFWKSVRSFSIDEDNGNENATNLRILTLGGKLIALHEQHALLLSASYNSRFSILYINFKSAPTDLIAAYFGNIRDLTQQYGWKTQNGRISKKCLTKLTLQLFFVVVYLFI